MWMVGIKDYGNVVATLQLQHWPGCISVSSSIISSCWDGGPSQGRPSISLLQGLYRAQAHCLCQQAALTLRSPLISVCVQVRMMMKRHPSGILQHSKDHISKHSSLPVWHVCSRVLWEKGFVAAWLGESRHGLKSNCMLITIKDQTSLVSMALFDTNGWLSFTLSAL